MKRDTLELLRSPECHARLALTHETLADGEIWSGELTCRSCGRAYAIREGIPRFVPAENYAANFGLQWNEFQRSQLDSHSGQPISRERFFAESGWSPEQLRDKWVLDVGCGAGRFAEIALSCGAHVVAVDYSSAVEACWRNLRGRGHLQVIQGDVYALPFQAAQFDFVYCFGVLQHTPDVQRTLHSLPQQLRPGGKLAVDVYPKRWINALWPKHWLRPFTRRMSPRVLFPLTRLGVRLLLPLSLALGRIPLVGRKLRYAVPVLSYDGVLPLSPAQVREWALLDTFDMLSARYDQPQDAATLESWLRELELEQIDVFHRGFIVGRAVRPAGVTSVSTIRRVA